MVSLFVFSEPTVCFNAVRPRVGVYGFFICLFMPTVCFNAVRPRGGVYGFFICLFRAHSLFQRSKTARWCIWFLYLSFQSPQFVSMQ